MQYERADGRRHSVTALCAEAEWLGWNRFALAISRYHELYGDAARQDAELHAGDDLIP